jgi:hypothetical protein
MEWQNSQEFCTFKDCLARRILAVDMSYSDDSELDEFTSYLAAEVWSTLPPSIQAVNQGSRPSASVDLNVEELPLDSTPHTFSETLVTYGYTTDSEHSTAFLRRVLSEYVKEIALPPTPWSATRTQECEMCERDVPLTYHHLIPRSTHPKVLKRGWHSENMLNSVAWLCR